MELKFYDKALEWQGKWKKTGTVAFGVLKDLKLL